MSVVRTHSEAKAKVAQLVERQPKKDDPVIQCPCGQIGKVASLKRKSSLGSSPSKGTNFDLLGSFQQSY